MDPRGASSGYVPEEYAAPAGPQVDAAEDRDAIVQSIGNIKLVVGIRRNTARIVQAIARAGGKRGEKDGGGKPHRAVLPTPLPRRLLVNRQKNGG